MIKKILKITEQEIINEWEYKDKVYISVLCITYNHGDLIYEALNSFLSQKTRYKFEVIVHDDCSNDQTINILREYQQRFPNIVKPIFQNKNQYSISPSLPIFNCFDLAAGDYIALCEGDDYWIDVTKIEKQINALIENKNINLAVHDAKCLSFNEKETKYKFKKYAVHPSVIPFDSISKVEYQFSPTASMFFRRSVLEKIPKIYEEAPCMDLFLEVFCGINGIYYDPKPMCVYRLNVPGSFFDRNNTDRLNQIKFMENVVKFTELLSNFIPIEKYNSISKKIHYFHKGLSLNKCLSGFSRKEIISNWFKSLTFNRGYDKRDMVLLLIVIGFPPSLIKNIYQRSKV